MTFSGGKLLECFKIVCTDFDHVLEKSGKINQGGILFEGEYYLWSRKRFCPPPITWALIHIATTYIACANAMPPPRREQAMANEPLSCHRNRNQLRQKRQFFQEQSISPSYFFYLNHTLRKLRIRVSDL